MENLEAKQIIKKMDTFIKVIKITTGFFMISGALLLVYLF
jgi:hypothetical protein